MRIRLQILSGKHAGREIELRKTQFLIGREDGCDLRPHSTAISRRHCLITADKEGVFIEDLKSSNGTFVNKVRTTGRHRLASGDKVLAGNLKFLVLLGNAPAEPIPKSPIDQMAGKSPSQIKINSDSDIMHLLGDSKAMKPPTGFIDLSSLPSAQNLDTQADAAGNTRSEEWPDFGTADAPNIGNSTTQIKLPGADPDAPPNPNGKVNSQSAAAAAIDLFRRNLQKDRP